MSSIDLIKHQVGYDFSLFSVTRPLFHGQTPGALIVVVVNLEIKHIIYLCIYIYIILHIISICKYLMNYHLFNL